MASRSACCRSLITGHGRLAIACVALSLSGVARADDASALVAAALPDHLFDPAILETATMADNSVDLGKWNASLADATFFEEGFQGDEAAAPANELAAGLGVQVDQKRRKFRARFVDYMANRSAAFGRMTDFFLGGADSGWHFVVDPTGEDEYTLQWKARFR